MTVAAAGAALTGLVTTVMVIAFGRPALVPAVAFGVLATVIQVVADRMVAKVVAAAT